MKTIAGLEVITIKKKPQMVRNPVCTLASQDETWWTGPISEVRDALVNVPKADRIVFYAEDLPLVEVAFKGV